MIALNVERLHGNERSAFQASTCLTIVEDGSERHQTPEEENADQKEFFSPKDSLTLKYKQAY